MSFRSRGEKSGSENRPAFVDVDKAAANRARVSGGHEESEAAAERRRQGSLKAAETARANGTRQRRGGKQKFGQMRFPGSKH